MRERFSHFIPNISFLQRSINEATDLIFLRFHIGNSTFRHFLFSGSNDDVL